MYVNRSAMLVEAVFKSTFGFSYVLFVTVVTLYHVDNLFTLIVTVYVKQEKHISLKEVKPLNLMVLTRKMN